MPMRPRPTCTVPTMQKFLECSASRIATCKSRLQIRHASNPRRTYETYGPPTEPVDKTTVA
jgi:hypothetical protein